MTLLNQIGKRPGKKKQSKQINNTVLPKIVNHLLYFNLREMTRQCQTKTKCHSTTNK